MSVQDRIREQVTGNRIVLFMKGTPQFPQCGFSATVAESSSVAASPITSRSTCCRIPEIRQGIKDYASWPTIPQLYLDGEFVGGCDIVKEMYQAGELAAAPREAARLANRGDRLAARGRGVRLRLLLAFVAFSLGTALAGESSFAPAAPPNGKGANAGEDGAGPEVGHRPRAGTFRAR
jgi:monothiol glutaredoxin